MPPLNESSLIVGHSKPMHEVLFLTQQEKIYARSKNHGFAVNPNLHLFYLLKTTPLSDGVDFHYKKSPTSIIWYSWVGCWLPPYSSKRFWRLLPWNTYSITHCSGNVNTFLKNFFVIFLTGARARTKSFPLVRKMNELLSRFPLQVIPQKIY